MLNPKKNRYFTLLSLVCAGTIIASCNKPAPPPISFSITGFKDVALAENGSEIVPVKVILEGGTNEQVTLSVEGLPTGVSAYFTVETNKPDFTSNLYLKDDSSKGGNYTVTLKGTSGEGVVKEYPFLLTTLDKTCAKKTSGFYNGTTTRRTGNGDVFTNYNFWLDPVNADRLLFKVNNDTVHMILNCNKNQLTIPRQDVGSYKIQGYGFIDQNYTIIDFYYLESHNNGDTISCDSRFTKQ